MLGYSLSLATRLHQFATSLWITAWIISCTSFAEYKASLTVIQSLCSLSYSVKHETKFFHVLSTVFILRYLAQYLVKSHVELTLS